MEFENTILPGVILIKPKIFGDQRGKFRELYKEQNYRNLIGDEVRFVQDNYSESVQNVLRGLHFQVKKPQGKLVTVLSGTVFDVAVDVNPISKTFGKYISAILSGDNGYQLYIPPGYAHGFCVLSETAKFHYKCTDYYSPDDERGVIWNCPELKIDWPIANPILSEKDKEYPILSKIYE
jgi:dTDP-4-dehydrorhamnose 3,5-epimerase